MGEGRRVRMWIIMVAIIFALLFCLIWIGVLTTGVYTMKITGLDNVTTLVDTTIKVINGSRGNDDTWTIQISDRTSDTFRYIVGGIFFTAITLCLVIICIATCQDPKKDKQGAKRTEKKTKRNEKRNKLTAHRHPRATANRSSRHAPPTLSHETETIGATAMVHKDGDKVSLDSRNNQKSSTPISQRSLRMAPGTPDKQRHLLKTRTERDNQRSMTMSPITPDNQTSLAKSLGTPDNQTSLAKSLGTPDNQNPLAKSPVTPDNQRSLTKSLGTPDNQNPLAKSLATPDNQNTLAKSPVTPDNQISEDKSPSSTSVEPKSSDTSPNSGASADRDSLDKSPTSESIDSKSGDIFYSVPIDHIKDEKV